MSRAAGSRYRVHARIGAGGMATVHLGRLVGPRGFTKIVAIKKLRPELADDPSFAASFLDEAKLASRVVSPNVVQTLDVVAEEGEILLVLEYVHGESLARLLEPGGADPAIASAVLSDVLHGLSAAHRAVGPDGAPLGIVHRDVSPQNILVGADGVARVLDFGVARALGRSQTTMAGHAKGKPAYMAPEQIHGQPVTPRTDLFAAAIVLWEMLTGERLFASDSSAGVHAQVLNAAVAPPSEHAPGIGLALNRVALRGLARSPEARYESAEAMAEDLMRAVPPASRQRVSAWVEAIAGSALGERKRLIAEIEADAHRTPRTRRAAAMAGGAVAGMAAIAIALSAHSGSLRPDPARAESDVEPTENVEDQAASARAAQTDAPAESTHAGAPSAAAPSAALASSSNASVRVGPATSGRGTPVATPASPPVGGGNSSSPACDPPYDLDDAGRRVFRRQCLQ